MAEVHYHTTTYLIHSVDAETRAGHVQEAVLALDSYRDDFDAIAVTGVSGLTVGSILAHHFHKHLIVVRKSADQKHADDRTHSSYDIEGPLDWTPRARYLIVDDFEGSGATVQRIIAKIGTRATYVGMLLYRDTELTWKRHQTERMADVFNPALLDSMCSKSRCNL